jgi:RNA polymerase-binding transcription factor DksA
VVKTAPIAKANAPVVAEKTEKQYYGDTELMFFKKIIDDKLTQAKEELTRMSLSLKNPNANGIDDTTGGNSSLDDGSETLEKEQLGIMAQRTKKFIENLEYALIRIKNKTYGICRETGKLIPKERLIAVPHATLSIEAKNNQYK